MFCAQKVLNQTYTFRLSQACPGPGEELGPKWWCSLSFVFCYLGKQNKGRYQFHAHVSCKTEIRNLILCLTSVKNSLTISQTTI